MKGVQCYEVFVGIALKNHAFLIYVKTSFSVFQLHSFSHLKAFSLFVV